MKRLFTLFAVFLAAILLSCNALAQSYSGLWHEIKKAQEKDLPKTVIELCDRIIFLAKSENNSGQLLKAYLTKSEYRRAISSDSLYRDIQEIEMMAEESTNPAEKMVIHSLLASIYASYARNNSWALNNRTVLEGNDSKDIKEWDKEKFKVVILNHIDESLKDYFLLHNTSSKDFIPFVLRNDNSHYFNHDLLHVIVNNSVKALNVVEFLSPEEMKAKKNGIIDSEIQFYKEAQMEDAIILASLFQIEQLDNKEEKLRTLLSQSNPSNELCGEILARLAQSVYSRGDKVEALALCRKGLKEYPNYKRGKKYFKDQIEYILTPSVNISCPGYVYPGVETEISVNHVNVDEYELLLYRIKNQEKKEFEVARRYQMKLNKPKNYQRDYIKEKIEFPTCGQYLIAINYNNRTDTCKNVITAGKMAVLVNRYKETLEAIVVDRLSGNPISGAKVTINGSRNSTDTVEASGLTDKNGKVFLKYDQNYYYEITATKGDDSNYGEHSIYLQDSYRSDSWSNNIWLFTDRSIYRPGQTVHLKGIFYYQHKDEPQTKEEREFDITVRGNNKTVYTCKLKTNEFGSVTTSFTLPTSALNGRYFITAKCMGKSTSTEIRVEEYKRPSFEVELQEPTGTFSLNDTVDIKGFAKAFSGAATAEAKVQYKVTSSISRFWGVNSSTNNVSSGEAQTDEKGEFTIPVILKKPENGPRYYGDYPYCFIVEASVTSISGETQSTSTAIYASNKGVVLSYSGNKLLDKNGDLSVTFKAYNLKAVPVSKEISYKLFTKGEGKKIAVDSGTVTSNTKTFMESWKSIPSGNYTLEMSTLDDKGRECTAKSDFTLFSTLDKSPIPDTKLWFYRDKEYIYYGTSYKDATIYVDIFAGEKKVSSKVVPVSNSINKIKFEYLPSYGDGAFLSICMVRDDEFYIKTATVVKPLPNKNLSLKWSVFRNKLYPGQKEEWKLSILDKDGKPANSELLAYMYDASLDMIVPHRIKGSVNFSRWIFDPCWRMIDIQSYRRLGIPIRTSQGYLSIPLEYDRFAYIMTSEYGGRIRGVGSAVYKTASAVAGVSNDGMDEMLVEETAVKKDVSTPEENQPDIQPKQVQIRSNFDETAFFYPQLRTDKDGMVTLSFTLPESLTRWKFQALAHTKSMDVGILEDEIVAQKDFMIAPYMPRFLRVGDHTVIASTITNLTDKEVEANVTFELFDPATEKIYQTQSKSVKVAGERSQKVSFGFDVSSEWDVVGVRVVADGGKFSDGEQHLLAVLSDRTPLIESVPMPIRGNQTRKFSLENLFNHHSPTATKKSLTVEFTGNPAWYAVQALPSLQQPESDNAICWSNVLYTNTFSSFIANSTPKIKEVFESWKKSGENKESMLSNLSKNQELKNILISEAPWVLEARNEEQTRERIATLFDLNNIKVSNEKAIKKLQELQKPDGGWSWFKGMDSSPWMTEYVLIQNIRAMVLTGEKMDASLKAMHSKGLDFMHSEMQEDYDFIIKNKIKSKGVSYFILRYLYLVTLEAEAEGKSPLDIVPQKHRKAYNYFLKKVKEVPRHQDIQEKAITAVVLNANGKSKDAGEYIQSIKEYLTYTDELGMFFDFDDNPYRWSSSHLSAQIAAMEAFDKVAKDSSAVEEMKIWLLKQKQTQMWKSNTFTAEAIYALLARGTNLLNNKGEVILTFADRTLSTTERDESGKAPVTGLGYIKSCYTDDNTVNATSIKVEKKDAGIGWGAVYATFSEKLANVQQNGTKELSISKELYIKKDDRLIPIKDRDQIKVGDIVTARMIIKVDREMQFMQLKEMRGSCLEPLKQLSGYKWGGGTWYYEEIKDASTNFFFYNLTKGTYVMEVNYRVSRAGEYEIGLATLQCAYAPEFSAHTTSVRVTVAE
ncbi:MAG: alpha-2-macroglobulin [Bacteroidales bacterium]|nr:alpha-2-macroglobulin [Bacteroidales bacterium]